MRGGRGGEDACDPGLGGGTVPGDDFDAGIGSAERVSPGDDFDGGIGSAERVKPGDDFDGGIGAPGDDFDGGIGARGGAARGSGGGGGARGGTAARGGHDGRCGGDDDARGSTTAGSVRSSVPSSSSSGSLIGARAYQKGVDPALLDPNGSPPPSPLPRAGGGRAMRVAPTVRASVATP